MTKPIKKAGFAQGIYAQSVSAKEVLGTLRITQDGRKFRYAKAGAADLNPGKIGLAAALSAYVVNEIILAAVAIGKHTLDLTITTGTAIAENELRGGYFQVQDGTGEGQNLQIAGNTAMASDGTTIQVALEDPIRVALDTTSEFNLVRSPWWAVYESDTAEAMVAGVAPIPVTTLYYYWCQTGGMCNVLQYASDAVGCIMSVSTNLAGAVQSITTTAIVANLPIVGIQYGTAGVNAEYTPVFLTID
jgi:hypothetical protein